MLVEFTHFKEFNQFMDDYDVIYVFYNGRMLMFKETISVNTNLN